MNKNSIITFLQKDEIKNILNELWVKHLYLVWSYSRWDNTKDSDIDLIYEKNTNTRVWWIKFIQNKMLLEKKLNKKIDLVNINYIYKGIKNNIEKDKVLIY